MAGEPIASKCKRAITISPDKVNSMEFIAPIHEEVGEPKEDEKEEQEAVEATEVETRMDQKRLGTNTRTG